MSCQTASPIVTTAGAAGVGTGGASCPDVTGAVRTLDLVVSPSKTFQKVLPLNIPNSIQVI